MDKGEVRSCTPELHPSTVMMKGDKNYIRVNCVRASDKGRVGGHKPEINELFIVCLLWDS